MEDRNPLLCPLCGQGMCVANHLDNALVCQRCKGTFPKLNGVVDLMPEDDSLSIAERLLEWPPLVRMVESRLWRRNPLVERLTEISFEQEARSILEAANLRGDERILDLACGTGSYSRLLAKHCPSGEVVALDLSIPALEYAARCAAEENLSNIRFIRTEALQIPFPDNSFDVINCCGALHLYADVDQVLTEVQRLLKPGGRFTTAVFRKPKGVFAGWLEWLSQTVLGAKSQSLGWLTEHLQKAGLDNSSTDDHGRLLIMRSTKD